MVNCLSDSSHLCLLYSLPALGPGLSAPMDWLSQADGTWQEVLQHPSLCPQPGISPGDGNVRTGTRSVTCRSGFPHNSTEQMQGQCSCCHSAMSAGISGPCPPHSLPTEGWLCSAHPTGEGSSMTDRSETHRHRARTRQKTSGEENRLTMPSSICGGGHVGC